MNAKLVVRDKDGKVNTVRYEAVNAMLLNEFLKEAPASLKRGGTKIKKQEATMTELELTIAQQQKGIEVITTAAQRAGRANRESERAASDAPTADERSSY